MMEEGEGEERALSVGPQPSAFACRSGGHHDRSVRTAAPAGPQMRTAKAIIPPVRIWGPVPKAQAVGAGALAAASSVLLAPQRAPAHLFHRLAALVPDEVLPRVEEERGRRGEYQNLEMSFWDS